MKHARYSTRRIHVHSMLEMSSRQVHSDVMRDQRVANDMIGQQLSCLQARLDTLGSEDALDIARCFCQASARVDHIVCKNVDFVITHLCYHVPTSHAVEVIYFLDGCWQMKSGVIHDEHNIAVAQKTIVASDDDIK